LPALALGSLGWAAAQSVVINEFVANHVGTDDHEYIELFSSPGVDLSSLRILHIEGDTTGAGLIDSVHTPGTTNAGGFWVTSFLTNILENGTISLFLVSGFTGAVGTDLDTNNDGVIDVTPWSSVLDTVAVSDGGAGDWGYGSTILPPSHPGGTLTVGGASRIPNGVDTDTPGDWMRNDFDLFGIPGFPGTPVIGEAVNTPGDVNAAVVPEPGTLAVLAIGALALVRRMRK
jgi:hypothetical protein